MLKENLIKARKKTGMSQEEVAEKLKLADKPFQTGKVGYHLDKDTTPIPR